MSTKLVVNNDNFQTEKIVIGHKHFSGSCLCCPNCGDPYIHHDRIVAYERDEDEKVVTKTIVRRKNTTSEKVINPPDNPSRRRHGFIVSFWCEFCWAKSDLCFAQHKGVTYLEWKVDKRPRPQEEG